MESKDTTTITVSKKNRAKLNVLKQHLGLRTIDNLMDKILKVIKKFKLEKEFE
jgi:hypothetical protein